MENINVSKKARYMLSNEIVNHLNKMVLGDVNVQYKPKKEIIEAKIECFADSARYHFFEMHKGTSYNVLKLLKNKYMAGTVEEYKNAGCVTNISYEENILTIELVATLHPDEVTAVKIARLFADIANDFIHNTLSSPINLNALKEYRLCTGTDICKITGGPRFKPLTESFGYALFINGKSYHFTDFVRIEDTKLVMFQLRIINDENDVKLAKKLVKKLAKMGVKVNRSIKSWEDRETGTGTETVDVINMSIILPDSITCWDAYRVYYIISSTIDQHLDLPEYTAPMEGYDTSPLATWYTC